MKNNPDYFSKEGDNLPVMSVLGPNGQVQHAGRSKSRRTGVSAECMEPENDSPPRNIPKSEDEEAEIRKALGSNILFRDISSSDMSIVIASMQKLHYKKGDHIITQGDNGSTFYVLASGTADCLIRIGDGQVNCVKQYSPGGSFGELALLYGTPRAASIVVTSDEAEAWEVDRATFRKVIMNCALSQRDRYFDFLRRAPFLDPLSNDQVSKIADVVEEVVFEKGQQIIKEFDEDDKCFYMIISGTCDVYKQFHPERAPALVLSYDSGAYFGELSLLSNNPRAASVFATSLVTCLRLDRHDFERLLGPVQDVLSLNMDVYNKVNAEMSKITLADVAAEKASKSTETTYARLAPSSN